MVSAYGNLSENGKELRYNVKDGKRTLFWEDFGWRNVRWSSYSLIYLAQVCKRGNFTGSLVHTKARPDIQDKIARLGENSSKLWSREMAYRRVQTPKNGQSIAVAFTQSSQPIKIRMRHSPLTLCPWKYIWKVKIPHKWHVLDGWWLRNLLT